MVRKKNSEALAIVCLILNILILPGLGTLIGGKTRDGVWQLVLLLGGLFIGFLFLFTIAGAGAFIGLLFMILPPLAAWIWGIVSGVQLIKETDK